MRTAGIAFAAGLGGSLSGWLLAASLAAAPAEQDHADNDADGGQPAPQLPLRSTALVEGPLLQMTYQSAGGTETADGGKDAFAWVYPDWVIAGSLSGSDVVVVPREKVVRLRIDDVSAGLRQTYREQVTELQRAASKKPEKKKAAAPSAPDAE